MVKVLITCILSIFAALEGTEMDDKTLQAVSKCRTAEYF